MRGETSATGDRSRRDRRLLVIVPIVLVAVAALAISNFHQNRQSSWQGIGFGMFATYDDSSSRSVRITIDEDGASTRVNVNGLFDDLLERSRVAPFGSAPGELAGAVLDRTDADAVVVEIWTVDVDGSRDQLVVRPERVRRVTSP